LGSDLDSCVAVGETLGRFRVIGLPPFAELQILSARSDGLWPAVRVSEGPNV